jgi:hypothetical protein
MFVQFILYAMPYTYKILKSIVFDLLVANPLKTRDEG